MQSLVSLVSLVPGSSVTVRVPGSSANIGPGFDSIGLALGIWDEYVATVTAEAGLRIDVTGEGAADLPCDQRHLVYRSMMAAWAQLRVQAPEGLHLSCRNAVPHGRGLGSSATAIVAGVVAAQGLCDIATEPERPDGGHGTAGPAGTGGTAGPAGTAGTAGTGGPDGGFDRSFDHSFANNLSAGLEGHPDNSSASVFGGMTLSWTDDIDPGQVHSIALAVSADVIPLVLLPDVQLSTATARAVLPAQIPHSEAARNSARAGLLVEAVTRRPDLLLAATREWLHQEQRRAFLPDSMALVDTLRGKGHAAVISGAGPSVLVLTTRSQIEDARALVDQPAWRVIEPGIPSTGASIVKRRC